MFVSPNPYAACKYLHISTKAEHWFYDAYKKAAESNLPIYKQLFRLGKKMDNVDFGSEEEFQNIAYLVLGSSDTLFKDGLSFQNISEGPFLNVHAIDKLCALMFNPQSRTAEEQFEMLLDTIVADIDSQDAVGASNKVHAFSPYMNFKLWYGFLNGLAGYARKCDNVDIVKNKEALTDSIVDKFCKMIAANTPFYLCFIGKRKKDKKDLDWFDAVCVRFISELSDVAYVRKYLPMLGAGPMKALFIYMNIEMKNIGNETKARLLDEENKLIQIRNKIAHGEMPWGQDFIRNGVRSLFWVSGAFGIIGCAHKLDRSQKLINRLSFFLQNPITGISILISLLSALCLGVLVLFAFSYFIWMIMGTPAFNRIDTDDMRYEEKAEFYEAAARGDTTALKDFQFKYKWLRDHGLKQTDR